MNLEKLIQEEKLTRTEGEAGVKNLARLCRLIGYKDNTYFGQFENGCYGDLIHFLEDNNGAVEAIVEFIKENFSENEEVDTMSDDDEGCVTQSEWVGIY